MAAPRAIKAVDLFMAVAPVGRRQFRHGSDESLSPGSRERLA
jgi:hypothetical protein